MSTSLRESLIRWLNTPYMLDVAIVVLAFLTQVLIWFNEAQTLSLHSLQILWLSANEPQTAFQWLMSPIAHSDVLSVGFIGVLSIMSLWLFARIAILVGLSNVVTFALFLLLNFNPEYNDVRLDIDSFQIVLPLWLLSVWLFIYWYRQHLYRAFLAWALTLWVGAIFAAYALVWVVFFPLCFLLWPSSGYRWWQRIIERGKFLLAYYALITLVVCLIPTLREEVIAFSAHAIEQVKLVSSEISLFLSADSSFNLSGFDGFLISLVLVLINALKVAGLLIIIFIWIALTSYRQGVLTGRVRLFFTFCFAFGLVYAALNLLYLGHLQSDLVYTPMTMILLWVNASGVFYVVDRWRYGHIKSERLLVVFWLFVAYALASVIAFGPSSDYKRAAGLWSQTQTYDTLYSNDAQSLYYAGYSPFSNNGHQFNIEYQQPQSFNLDTQDLILHTQNRHLPLPKQLAQYEIIETFRNNRGDQIFALRLNSVPNSE